MKRLPFVLSAVLFAAVLLLALGRYGLTQDQALYVAVGLLVPACICALWLPSVLDRASLVALAVCGALLLLQVALRPTDEARGFTVAALGWMSLVLAVQWGGQPQRGRWLFFLLVFLGLVEALVGLSQALGGVDRIFTYDRRLGPIASGTFINRNHFAGLANMGLGLTLGWLYTAFVGSRRRREHRSETLARSWLLILASAFIGLAVLLSRSRGGALSMVGMLGFVFVMLFLDLRRGRRVRGLPAAAIVVLSVAIVLLAALAGVGGLVDRFAEGDALSRPQIYRDTVELIADHPLTGVGPGRYVWEFRPYQTESIALWFNHAHNDYLETAAEWGIPLALLFWAFVLRRFYGLCRVFVATEDPWSRGASLGCAAALTAILIHSLVDFNLHIPANLMIFAAILGLGWTLELELKRTPLARVLAGPGSGP
jgi:O-antigen ligase